MKKKDAKKIKILFTLPNLGGGGAERVIINIIKRLEREKYDITLLLVDETIDTLLYLIPKDIEIFSLNKRRTREALFALIQKIWEIRPHIIFSTTNRMNLLVLMASFFISKKIKIYIREPNLPSAQITNGTLKLLDKVLISLLYPKSYRIVAQTPQMAQEIEKHFGIKREKIVTQINPIDKETIQKNLKERVEIFDTKYRNLVAVGRLSYQKGFDLLIQVMEKVIKEAPKTRLYILGEGEDREKLQKLIDDYRLDKHVFLMGFQQNPHKYIQAADAFVLSSRWEGLPNVVLEAMYIGTFVIMSRVNPYVETIIEEKRCGLLYHFDDIEKLGEYLIHLEEYKKKKKNCEYEEPPITLFDEIDIN